MNVVLGVHTPSPKPYKKTKRPTRVKRQCRSSCDEVLSASGARLSVFPKIGSETKISIYDRRYVELTPGVPCSDLKVKMEVWVRGRTRSQDQCLWRKSNSDSRAKLLDTE